MTRVAIVICFTFLSLPRLDQCLMPGLEGSLYVYDAGFGAWISMLSLDHSYNNPAARVFTSILIGQLRDRRAAAIVRRVRDEARAGGCPQPSKRMPPPHGVTTEAACRWHAAVAGVCEQLASKRRRARTRWHLARLMLSNPQLQRWRASRGGHASTSRPLSPSGGAQGEMLVRHGVAHTAQRCNATV